MYDGSDDYSGPNACLETGKAHKVGAETEACTLARREADARGKEIQERECDRRDDRDREDLLNIQLLLGDDEGGKRNREALQEVLDRARYELSNCKAVHLIIRGVIFYPVGCDSV